MRNVIPFKDIIIIHIELIKIKSLKNNIIVCFSPVYGILIYVLKNVFLENSICYIIVIEFLFYIIMEY